MDTKITPMTNASQVFDELIEALKAEKRAYLDEGQRAQRSDDFARGRILADKAERTHGILKRVEALRIEWIKLAPTPPKGEATKRDVYYVPILRALEARGGAAQTQTVLDDVLQQVKDKLTKADLDPVPSDPNMPRWRNQVMWARNDLVDMGRMLPSRVRGTWEISTKGREWLKSHSNPLSTLSPLSTPRPPAH